MVFGYCVASLTVLKGSIMAKVVDAFEMAQALIERLPSNQPHRYLLTWEGGKTPFGASIDGVEIGRTQDGLVTGAGREQLGYYERVIEFGGDSRTTQCMLIATAGHFVEAPPGGSVVDLSASPERPPTPLGTHLFVPPV
jgi:hypothetical protein